MSEAIRRGRRVGPRPRRADELFDPAFAPEVSFTEGGADPAKLNAEDYSEEDEETIRERLKALGYLD